MTEFQNILANHIVILDGAMGTMVQSYKLSESDFRGNQFQDHIHDLQGNNDILCLTQPDIVKEIHPGCGWPNIYFEIKL